MSTDANKAYQAVERASQDIVNEYDDQMKSIHSVFLPDDYPDIIRKSMENNDSSHVCLLEDVDNALTYGWRDTIIGLYKNHYPDINRIHESALYLIITNLHDIITYVEDYMAHLITLSSGNEDYPMPGVIRRATVNLIKDTLNEVCENRSPLYTDGGYCEPIDGSDDWFSFITTYAFGYTYGWKSHIKVRQYMERKGAKS